MASAVIAASCSGDDSDEPSDVQQVDPVVLEVLSSHPDYATGGDALVAVTVHQSTGLGADEVSVTSGGEDVTGSFETDPDDPGRLVGVVDGLDDGETELVATAGDHTGELTLTNHPDTAGPLFSGEHLPLVECTTESFGLEPSTPEDDCFAPTEVSWEYVDSDGERHDLDDPDDAGEDAELVTVDGEEVPLVIRTETGVLNRSVYQITTLEGAWNERLVYSFGGGCDATFSQGSSWVEPHLDLLREGYAAATATFNTNAVLCNSVISAETMSMVKEHFVLTQGEPQHTIGEGGSGGAIQQLAIAQNYPGLLDGIAPSVPFPDSLSISSGVADCRLLNDYYDSNAGSGLDEDQRAAINGHATPTPCAMWDELFVDAVVDPTTGCADDAYHPDDNPDGLRCLGWETNVAIGGRDPETGFANRGLDNVGVQYGLEALNDGVISAEEFLDLNEQLGGFDIDGEPQPERHEATSEPVSGFASGQVVGPWGGLPDTPIILIDSYSDECDIHDRVRSYALLDRLSEEDGSWPATTSLWTIVPEDCGLTLSLGDDDAIASTLALDEWLTAAADHEEAEGSGWQEALAATKPETAESRCLIEGGEEIVGPDANEDPDCVEHAPVHGEPRMAAGAPRSGDVLKCELVPVEEAEHLYEVDLDDDQQEQLAQTFPDGVCDYDQPSVGYGPPVDVWQSFLD